MFRIIKFVAVIGAIVVSLCSLASSEEELLFLEAMQLVEKKNYVDAELNLKKLVRSSPRNGLYWFNLGNTQYLQKKWNLAKKSYWKTISLKGELAPVARFYYAKVQRNLKYIDRAALQLSSIRVNQLPSHVQTAVEKMKVEVQEELLSRSHSAYQLKQYRTAERFIRLAETLGEDEDVAALRDLISEMRGKVVSNYNATSKRRELRDNGNRSLFTLVRSLSERVRHEIQALSVQAELAFGWNTNIDADGPGDSPEENRSLLAQLNFDKNFVETSEFASDVRAYLGVEEFLHRRDNPFDQQSAGESMSVSVESINRWIRHSDNYYIMPKISMNMNSGTYFWQKMEVGFSYEKKQKSSSYIAEYRLSKLTPSSDGASYLASGEQVLNFSAAHFWRFSSFSFGWEFRRYSGQDIYLGSGLLPESFESHGPALAVLWNSRDRIWRVDSTLYLALRQYESPEQPSGVERKDTYSSFFTRVSYWWESGLGQPNLYLQMELINNKSTLGQWAVQNRNYNQNIFYLGMIWEWDR
ncbi:MAG: hypothetical protein KDD61_10860 [Bdellovibrionales bacterium]|nr:hypothetical protein [Bdellovibrionales bacterium]